MRTIDKRLEDLERAYQVKDDSIQVVFYDSETRELIEDIRPDAQVILWLPTREDGSQCR